MSDLQAIADRFEIEALRGACPANRTVVGVSEVLRSAGSVHAAVRACGLRFFALDPAEL